MICVECSLELLEKIKNEKIKLPTRSHVVFHCLKEDCERSDGWVMYNPHGLKRYTYY